MCQLIEVHYACSHSRRILHEACATAKRFGPRPQSRAPNFCLQGLEVVGWNQSKDDCGRGGDGLTCSQLQTLKPLERRYEEILDELRALNKRVKPIQSILKLGLRPEYDWQKARREGKDVDFQRETLRLTFKEAIPNQLNKWVSRSPSWMEQLHAAFKVSSEKILSKTSGMVIDPRCELAVSVSDLTIAEEDEDIDLMNSDLRVLNAVWTKVDQEAEDIVEMLEEAAAIGSLDAVGWVLPHNVRSRSSIQIVIEERQIRPIRGKFATSCDVNMQISSPFTSAPEPEFDTLDTAED